MCSIKVRHAAAGVCSSRIPKCRVSSSDAQFSDFRYFNYVHTAKQEQISTQRVENRPHSTSSPRAQLSHSSRPIRMLELPVSVLESCWCAQLEATVPFAVLWKSQQSQSGLKEKKTTNKHIYHWEKALSGIVCSLNVSLTWKALLCSGLFDCA